jgi:hypothetical protein
MLIWIDKAKDVGLFLLVTSLFWGFAVHSAMLDYAIQHHAVMATHSAVVTDDSHHQWVEYTTNAGQHVDAALGNGLSMSHVELGETVRVKYVSDDPGHAYLTDYQPRYVDAIVLGSLFLGMVALFAWKIRQEWDTRDASRAAEKVRAGTTPAPPLAPSHKSRRKAPRKSASSRPRPRKTSGSGRR